MSRGIALAAAAVMLAAPASARGQASLTGHERMAGCYAFEPTAAAPWLNEVGPRFRLTLEPAESDSLSGPQFQVESLAGQPPRYSFRAWSLFGDGQIVSIVWSSERDQVQLFFAPDPRQPLGVTGTTTLFTHQTAMVSEPVDVRVRSVGC